MNTCFRSVNDPIYIVTFYSHFGAVRFKRLCDKTGVPARCMPVPRKISSSCGTCVRCEGNLPEDLFADRMPEEIEQIVHIGSDEYEVIYRAADS